jgi:hypothetical protein
MSSDFISFGLNLPNRIEKQIRLIAFRFYEVGKFRDEQVSTTNVALVGKRDKYNTDFLSIF